MCEIGLLYSNFVYQRNHRTNKQKETCTSEIKLLILQR